MTITKNRPTARSCMEHANKAKVYIDRHAKPDSFAVRYYMEHLQDCYNCPTLGYLAKKECYNSPSINFPSKYVRNKALIEYNSEVIKMQARIRKRLSDLYPRTKYIRQYIIDNDRLSLYYVKQSTGFSFWDRFKIGAKIFFKKLSKEKRII